MNAKANLNALDDAIVGGDLKTVQKLISTGVSPAIGSLFVAIAEDKAEILERLVAVSPLFDQLDPYWKQTPLARAVECKNKAAVEILLRKGASPNKTGRFGPPLFIAIRKNFADGVRLLLAAGADLEMRVPPAAFTPLISAAQMGYVETIRLLLDAGANPLAVDSLGRSAFEVATQEGERAAANLLAALPQPARRIVQKSSVDALNDAVRNKDLTRVDECLVAGANPSARDKWGWNPLERAVQSGSPELVRKLIAAGADVNSHRKGVTPLSLAVSEEKVDLAEILLTAGAVPKSWTKDDVDPFWTVCVSADLQMARLFLKFGANPNASNFSGESCLMSAIEGQRADSLVPLLLAHGSSVNAADNNGQTALFYAVQSSTHAPVTRQTFSSGAVMLSATSNESRPDDPKALKLVKLLIQHGARVNHQDADGRTALTFVKSRPVAEFLIKHGASTHIRDKGGHDVDFWLQRNGVERNRSAVQLSDNQTTDHASKIKLPKKRR